MRHFAPSFTALLLALCSASASPALNATRRAAFTRRIVAVGDLHSDYNNTLISLQLGKVIDDQANWAGGDTIFVQTGDIMDRGDDTILIFELFEKLRGQAEFAGGKFLTNLGNHEMLNVRGDWRYVDESEIATFGNATARFEMITRGWIGQAMRDNYNITTRIPLHPAVGALNSDFDPESPSAASNLSHAALSFVHGGLAFGYPNLTPYPSRINSLGASLLQKMLTADPLPAPYPPAPTRAPLPASATADEIELNGTEGPYWARDWAEPETEEMCVQVEQVLNSIGCEKMFMGHTVRDEIMLSRCNSKIVLIDTGISHGVQNRPSALEIVYSLKPTATERTWIEEHIGTAYYPTTSSIMWSETREVVGDFEAWHI